MVKQDIQPAIGIFPDIPFDKYLRIDAVSNSYMGRLKKTPAHAKIAFNDTAATLFGQAAHCLCLEGEKEFNNRVIESTALTINSKATQGLIIGNPGMTVVMKGDIDRAKYCRDSILSHPTAAMMFDVASHRECTLAWKDEETGLMCKARPDLLAPKSKDLIHAVIVDLKFLRGGGSETRKFFYEIKDKYALQAAFYCQGASIVCKDNYNVFSFIVCETEPPYAVAVHTLSEEWLFDWGQGEISRLLRLEARCRANNDWPSYSNAGTETHDLPEWLRSE